MILGLTNSSSSSGILSYIYKESTNSYTKITYPLTTYRNGTLLSDGNTICLVLYDSPSNGYIYNRSTDTWSNIKLNGSVVSSTTRLYYACCVESHIHTVTVENYDNSEKILRFWGYDISTKSWEERNIFEPSDGISFALGSADSDNGFVYKNKIYLIGMDTNNFRGDDSYYGALQYDISTSYFVRYPDFLIKDVNGEVTTAFNISSDAFIVDNNTKKLYSCVPEV